jgi:HK97 gp10 family phage protein
VGIRGEEQLLTLAGDVEKAGAEVRTLGRGVVEKGCLNVKTDARSRIDRKWWAQIARTVNYDVDDHGAAIRGEIGPDLAYPSAHLANIPEYGTPRHPPRPFLGPALSAEEPRFLAAASEVAVAGLWR